MRFYFHEHAETEFDRAVEYYEDCRHGLGVEFAQEVYATIDRIIQHPDAWSPMSKNTRRCLVNRFPFGVIYQVKSSFVSIIAVADLRRRPDYWIEREWAETTLWHAVYATLGLDMAGKQVYKYTDWA